MLLAFVDFGFVFGCFWVCCFGLLFIDLVVVSLCGWCFVVTWCVICLDYFLCCLLLWLDFGLFTLVVGVVGFCAGICCWVL